MGSHSQQQQAYASGNVNSNGGVSELVDSWLSHPVAAPETAVRSSAMTNTNPANTGIEYYGADGVKRQQPQQDQAPPLRNTAANKFASNSAGGKSGDSLWI
ncbi:hypothetical protein NADFUDRAFT_83814, partial [Nadsonia fulvescens var. elongata DSM 6958]